MFTMNDIPMFILNFFLILPLVTLVHEAGHVVAARLFGGKIHFCIGTGKMMFQLGSFEVRRMYFMEGWCQYKDLRYNKTWAHVSIYLAGSLFNLLVILTLNLLISHKVIPVDLFFYQYSYFSFYFIFFSLFPYRNGDGKPSDGMAIYDVIRHGKTSDPID
ncbi:M50 family metallopeptidase [Halobacillus litoralis]|uniref:M50 family metallopeptidase n=1 Tax=Halobacillus litoralis TaxID=45668 RepID=UPI001CFD4D50|nr:M50 family metallopeptidase [Halobacillus litoralis]